MEFIKENAWIKAGLIAVGIDIVLSILGAIPCINCLVLPINCVAWLIIPLGCGYLAAMWSNLKRDQYQEAAVQGALSGLIVGVVGGIVQLVISFISSLLNVSLGSSFSYLEEQDSSYLNNLSFLPAGIAGTLLFGSVCCIVGIAIDVILSVLGAIIYVAVSKK